MASFDRDQVTFSAQSLLPNGKVRVEPCQSPTTLTCVYVSWNSTDPTAGASGQCVNASGAYIDGADCVTLEVR